MTYLEFHLVFILPPLALLALLGYRAVRRGERLAGGLGRGTRFALNALFALVGVALVYTTPWDNYLIYREVWGYPADRVLFAVGYVPIEEYAFFVLQTLLAGFWLFLLARRMTLGALKLPPRGALLRWTGAALALGLAAAGLLLLRSDWGTYLGLILIWAGPVLAFQWAFGGDILVARWPLVVPALLVPTLYLWLADRVAIGLGVWWLNPELTTGLHVLGLPVEEMVFFLVTNVFVAFGLTLVLTPHSLERARRLLALVRKQRSWQAVLVLWAVSMVPAPLFPDAFPVFLYLSTGLLAFGTLLYALGSYARRAWLLFAVAVGFGLSVEWLGEASGVPFGRYRYSEMGPSLLGVPLFVPLGWWAFTFIAIAVPTRLKLWLAPLALVAWDLGLDPLMVHKGFWTFAAGGVYYGVPLSNFVGWYLAGFALVWLLLRLEPRLRHASSRALRLAFVAQGFLMSVGLAYFGLPGAGLASFMAMALLALPGLAGPGSKRLEPQDA